MKLEPRQMLQIKSYFTRRKMLNLVIIDQIASHIDILRGYQFYIQAFKSQMCFELKSTKDPEVLCSTRTKSKRNSSRLDIHREAKNWNLSLENVAKS